MQMKALNERYVNLEMNYFVRAYIKNLQGKGNKDNQAFGDACGVMVIVAGYVHGDTSSNPGPG